MKGLAVLMAAALALVTPAPTRAGAVKAPETVAIPAGAYIRGSDRAEREYAYKLDEAAYGHSITRKQKWYENEPARATATLEAYRITRTPITNAQYAEFVHATGHRRPAVNPREWKSYRLIHPFRRALTKIWRSSNPPKGRENHPVILVSYDDALAYAAWLSKVTGKRWRLPSEAQWEKAARGVKGWYFPWGDAFDPTRLNSHDKGPFDTMPVGSFPSGASEFGVLDGAGQVYEWTADAAGKGRHIVKGGSWDDKGCGVCRPAARHSRPDAIKHILIGFRLVVDE